MKTAKPRLTALVGTSITGVWRRGKLVGLEAGDLTLVVHLMQAGRLRLTESWSERPARPVMLSLDIAGAGRLELREYGTERRATAHLVPTAEVAQMPTIARLGPEPIGLDRDAWRQTLAEPPARLHVALRDGRRIAGIGRCYASEIMWAAKLAPFTMTTALDDEAWARLAEAADWVLETALNRERGRITTSLPDRHERTTAVHGHYGDPCMRCGTALQRVSFRDYELVYCPPCQTGGRAYADRRMSRLLR